MKHLGDITKISGYDVPIVDIVVGGSPCQDLSVAGLRKGLAGERSGLFMEQVRIIKEMREKERKDGKANVDIRPRFMVWENVAGAFSSNGGEDFRCVLEETAKIADEDAVIPGLAKGQKWTPSGCIMGDGWSIAWRLHDAQFWGVPQRRKRISLVADFNGQTAPEILFERKGMPRDIAESATKGKDIARTFENGIGDTIAFGFNRERCGAVMMVEKMPTLQAAAGESGNNKPMVMLEKKKCYGIGSFSSNSMKSSNPNSGFYEAKTARTLDNNGGNPSCNQGGIAVVETYDVRISKEGTKNWRANCYPTNITRCLDTQGENPDTNHGGVCIVECFSDVAACRSAADGEKGVHSQMLSNTEGNFVVENPSVYGMDRASFNQGKNAKYDFSIEEEISAPLVARGPNAVGIIRKEIKKVRRLTPLECERLQGFPDGWTDIGDWVDSKGKKHKGDSDAPRYKALGNSIALPFWRWMAKRMCAYLKNPTMASLFDGIGGFPLVYMEAGCEPVWASEIEEFPIAVTKLRFGEN